MFSADGRPFELLSKPRKRMDKGDKQVGGDPEFAKGRGSLGLMGSAVRYRLRALVVLVAVGLLVVSCGRDGDKREAGLEPAGDETSSTTATSVVTVSTPVTGGNGPRPTSSVGGPVPTGRATTTTTPATGSGPS